MLLDCSPHRADLHDRLDTVRRILQVAHTSGPTGPSIEREARGMAIVLIYAAYENLLKTLCRSILETTKALRVGNRRLKPGLQLFASFQALQAISAGDSKRIWRDTGSQVVRTFSQTRDCTINPGLFPVDGTHMRRTQIVTFCKIFDLGDPGPILRDVWARVDTIVSERNAIAHGGQTPDEIGRNYTYAEILNLAHLWEQRWDDFLTWVETQAGSRDFYRNP